MYEVKNRIYLDFSKNQKSALCNFLRALVKKNPDLSCDEILDKFFDDERYYLELEASRFSFIKEFIDEDWFFKDTKLFIQECMKYYEYKKKQEPLITAQKEYEKQKRAYLREVKMSKEPATKRQQSYYKSLCKKFGCEKIDTTDFSKLQMRDLIKEIIDEHSRDSEDIIE